MKKLNEKGFAISAVLYTMLILMVLLMFLILAVLDNGRTAANKLSDKVKEEVDSKVYDNLSTEEPDNLLYRVLANSEAQDETYIKYQSNGTAYPSGFNGFNYFAPGAHPSYPEATIRGNGLFKVTDASIYYFRGDVNNNYVLFSGYCWRIVRTTESKGVKVIYSGKPSANGCDASLAGLVTEREQYDDASINPSSTYLNSHMQSRLEDWYVKNISPASQEKLEFFSLCNDTSTNTWKRMENSQPNIQICEGELKVKIGLLTADEAVYGGSIRIVLLAGTSGSVRLKTYLRIAQPYPSGPEEYLNIYYATVSGGSKAGDIIYIGGEGQIDSTPANTLSYPDSKRWTFGIRPVISFAPGTTYSSGTGTISDPYVIE